MRYNNDIQDNDVQDIDTFFKFNDFDNLDETITHHMRKINKRKKKRTHKHNTQNTNQSFNNSYNQIPVIHLTFNHTIYLIITLYSIYRIFLTHRLIIHPIIQAILITVHIHKIIT